jgi:hypothetical protein
MRPITGAGAKVGPGDGVTRGRDVLVGAAVAVRGGLGEGVGVGVGVVVGVQVGGGGSTVPGVGRGSAVAWAATGRGVGVPRRTRRPQEPARQAASRQSSAVLATPASNHF